MSSLVSLKRQAATASNLASLMPGSERFGQAEKTRRTFEEVLLDEDSSSIDEFARSDTITVRAKLGQPPPPAKKALRLAPQCGGPCLAESMLSAVCTAPQKKHAWQF